MGIIELLTLLFIGLKVAEVEDVASWSWWVVFAPMWIGYPVLGMICYAIYLHGRN